MKIRLIALSCVIILGCTDQGTNMTTERKKVTLDTGTRFAQALVAKRFADAHAMLTAELQRSWPAEKLGSRFEQMIAIGPGPVVVDGHTQYLDDWRLPARKPGDIGWVYVSISDSGFAEAVTVIVTDEGGVPKIGSIEWGRP